MKYYGLAVWIYSVKIVEGHEHGFDFAARTSRFRCAMPKGKRKNRSTDVSNISNNSSVGNTTALNISKRARVNSANNKQSTLLQFVDSAAMATTGAGNKTFTAGNDENHSVDSCSLKDQFSKMETLLNDKLGKLEGKIGVSESNLSAQITRQFDSLRSEIFSLQQENDYLKTKVSDTEDAIEELENEVQRLQKTVEKEREFRNDLEQYQRRDSLRFLGVGPDGGRETADDCEEKVLAIINDELGLNHILSADISIAHRIGVRFIKPRPILVKFLSRKHKTQVMQKRRLLKGSGRGIVEDLTPINMKRLKSVQQHPKVKNSWTKEGTIHAVLHNGKIVKVTEGNLKIIDDAAVGSAPVLEIEMSEVLAPPDNVERRGTIVHQRTHDSAGVAASTPKYDRDSRLLHRGAPVRHKNDQAVNSDHRRPPWERRQSTWERRPRSDHRPPPSWRQTSPHGRAASSGDRRASSPHGQSTSSEDRRQASSSHGQVTSSEDRRQASSPHGQATSSWDRRAYGRATASGDRQASSPHGRAASSRDRRASSPRDRAASSGDCRTSSLHSRAASCGNRRASLPHGHAAFSRVRLATPSHGGELIVSSGDRRASSHGRVASSSHRRASSHGRAASSGDRQA